MVAYVFEISVFSKNMPSVVTSQIKGAPTNCCFEFVLCNAACVMIFSRAKFMFRSLVQYIVSGLTVIRRAHLFSWAHEY